MTPTETLESWDKPLCIVIEGEAYPCRLLGALKGRDPAHVIAVDHGESETYTLVNSNGKHPYASSYSVCNIRPE